MIWDPVLWAFAFASLGAAIGSAFVYYMSRSSKRSDSLPKDTDKFMIGHYQALEIHNIINHELDYRYPLDETEPGDQRTAFAMGFVAGVNWVKVIMGDITEEGIRKYYERLGLYHPKEAKR
ncbi:MAG: hypothetical protein V3W22_07305 [Thermoplasmata archaeon]